MLQQEQLLEEKLNDLHAKETDAMELERGINSRCIYLAIYATEKHYNVMASPILLLQVWFQVHYTVDICSKVGNKDIARSQ